jgi:hypothetical protein
MKKIYLLNLLLSLLLLSCQNKELSKQKAIGICEIYIKTHQQFMDSDASFKFDYTAERFSLNTFIAIDNIYEDYGSFPELYKILAQKGIISLRPIESYGLGPKKYEANIVPGNGLFMQTRTWQTRTDGNVKQFIFKGYTVSCEDADISSNANENKAEAELTFDISNISIVQEVFNNPVEKRKKYKVNFKLFDSGWKIVEDEDAKKLLVFSYIDNPIHWLGN